MIYVFGPFSLDTDAIRLCADGANIAVEPQVFSLVQFLIENRERVVTKDELINEVWDGRIVSDGTLNSRINAARRALGDDGKTQTVIKTFPRRGFRFVAKIEEPAAGEEAVPQQAPGAISEKPSILVLPFENMSGDPEQEYFSDGITEDIIAALGHLRQYFVISRNTTFTYKRQVVDPHAAARELGVRYVLGGSVRKVDNRVRISAQLADGGTGKQIWADHYDRDLKDIFAVQDEITAMVVGTIEPEMAAADRRRARSKPPENLDAWDLCQHGMAFIWAGGKHGNREEVSAARHLFEKVIELDPNVAEAYAGLGWVYFFSIIFGYSEDPDRDRDKIIEIGRRAVALASEDSLAHICLCNAHMVRGEGGLAIHHGQRATELNPSSSHAHLSLGQALSWTGRPQEALQELEMALKLSPRDPTTGSVGVRFAEIHLQLGNYDQAAAYADTAIQRPETQILGNCVLTAALTFANRHEEAKTALDTLRRRRPDFTVSLMEKTVQACGELLRSKYVEGLRNAGLSEE